jgi:hypothetical protein
MSIERAHPRGRARGRTARRIALAAAVLLVACPGVAAAARSAAGAHAQRYVSPTGDDRNDGSRRRPWRTIRHAGARARPGGTIRVAPGHYRGAVQIRRHGAPGRPIRFVSEQRWGARLTAGSATAVTVVEIRGDRLTFEGFDVSGAGADGTAGIDVEGSHVTVAHNRVHDVSAPCARTGNGVAGIVAGGGLAGYRNHDVRIEANVVEDIGRGPRDGSCRLAHGIYAAVPRVTVVNNIVSRARGDGITSWHAASRLTVANNVAAMNGGAGILIGSGDSGATATGHVDTLVANNIVEGNALYGITESSDGVHPVGPGNRYLNNLAFANRGDGRGGPTGATAFSDGAVASGTIEADPQFSPQVLDAARRYRVEPTSPAIDAGTPVGAPRYDFDGVRRPQGRCVDIGPYELRSTGPWGLPRAGAVGGPGYASPVRAEIGVASMDVRAARCRSGAGLIG